MRTDRLPGANNSLMPLALPPFASYSDAAVPLAPALAAAMVDFIKVSTPR